METPSKSIPQIIINHFENGKKEFQTKEEFVEFMETIYKENEGWEGNECAPPKPTTYEESVDYLVSYCDNFTLDKW